MKAPDWRQAVEPWWDPRPNAIRGLVDQRLFLVEIGQHLDVDGEIGQVRRVRERPAGNYPIADGPLSTLSAQWRKVVAPVVGLKIGEESVRRLGAVLALRASQTLGELAPRLNLEILRANSDTPCIGAQSRLEFVVGTGASDWRLVPDEDRVYLIQARLISKIRFFRVTSASPWNSAGLSQARPSSCR